MREDPHDLLSYGGEAEGLRAFNVHTVPAGYNCGREYCFRTLSEADFDAWIGTLTRQSIRQTPRVERRKERRNGKSVEE